MRRSRARPGFVPAAIRCWKSVVCAIIRNRANLNIDFMFLEQSELVPVEYALHLGAKRLPLCVARGGIERFVADAAALSRDGSSWITFLDRFVMRR
jgi:hypothetical protein